MAPDGEARALRLFCENDPDLKANHSKTHGTIPIVIYFVDKPSEQPVFATTIPSGTRARTGEAALPQGGYVGQTSPSPPYLQRRYLTRLEREALGEGSVSWDAAARPVHGGGAPALKTATFQ